MTNVTISIRSQPSPTTSFSLGIVPYMHREDVQIRGYIRSCAPCPAVWTLSEDSHTNITKQWQYYMLAINPNMSLDNVRLLLDNNLAFCNETGLRNRSDPRADYFYSQNLTEKPPQFDKVRTCSRNCLTGVEIYSLGTALKATKNVLQGFLWSRKGTLQDVRDAISTRVLSVKTFDSRSNPPLKPGRTYPRTISEIDPADYLYTPQHHREMFIVANIVNRSGEVSQFPRGALYSWTQDSTIYSFLPHISNPTYGKVLCLLDNLIKLPVNSDVPRPYRSN